MGKLYYHDIGLTFHLIPVTYDNEPKIKFQIWDCNGNDNFLSRQTFYRNKDFILYFYLPDQSGDIITKSDKLIEYY